MVRTPCTPLAETGIITRPLRTYTRIGTAIMLAVVLTFGAFVPSLAPSLAVAVTQNDVDGHLEAAEAARKKAAAAEGTAAALAQEIATLEADEARYRELASSLDGQISAASKKTGELTASLNELKNIEQSLRSQIESTTAEYESQQRQLSQRIHQEYVGGEDFLFELIFGATDLSDFVSRTEYALRLIEENAAAAESLELTKRQLESSKIELDSVLADTAAKQAEAASAESELRNLRASREAAAASAEQLQAQKSGMMATSEANADRLRALAEAEEAEASRLATELKKASSGSGIIEGSLAWPTPGFTRVTSPYGYRIHPILGVNKLHTGIDVGRNVSPDKSIDGAQIVAAAAGKVISAGYRSGYGNTVVLDHGNGLTTLYAHQQSGGIKVSAGQQVARGQRIGTVGNTGSSTAPHLHYEVRVNGSAVNPMGYY